MNNRGQAALEYLMTYGWALIVIAVAIGLLVIMMSSSTSGIQCTGPTGQITLQDYTVDSSGAGFVMLNATGAGISDVELAATSGGFGGTWTGSTSVSAGSTFTVSGLTVTGTQLNNATVTLQYTKASGLDANAVITCNGMLS